MGTSRSRRRTEPGIRWYAATRTLAGPEGASFRDEATRTKIFPLMRSLTHEIEVYAGTLHGWCPPGSAVYHEAQAERAWSRLLALFEAALA